MELVVLADETQKEELTADTKAKELTITWIKKSEDFKNYRDADGYLDLLFDHSTNRIDILKNCPSFVGINSVEKTLSSLQLPFVRINAWPTFLKRTVIEASCVENDKKKVAEAIFRLLNKKIEWLPDEPGFISARVVAAIINEAYFTLGEDISSKSEIDIAMKLGTNYPYGPFEWCENIGVKRIYTLLNELSKTNPRYKPAELLQKEALEKWQSF